MDSSILMPMPSELNELLSRLSLHKMIKTFRLVGKPHLMDIQTLKPWSLISDFHQSSMLWSFVRSKGTGMFMSVRLCKPLHFWNLEKKTTTDLVMYEL